MRSQTVFSHRVTCAFTEAEKHAVATELQVFICLDAYCRVLRINTPLALLRTCSMFTTYPQFLQHTTILTNGCIVDGSR